MPDQLNAIDHRAMDKWTRIHDDADAAFKAATTPEAKKSWFDERARAATMLDGISERVKARQNKITAKKPKKRATVAVETDPEPVFVQYGFKDSGESYAEFQELHDAWKRRNPNGAAVAAPAPKAAKAPEPQPAPVAPIKDKIYDDGYDPELLKKLLSPKKPEPVAQPVVEVSQPLIPHNPDATLLEDQAIHLLAGWSHVMKFAEREKWTTIRDAYNARMKAKREADAAANRPPAKTAEQIASEDADALERANDIERLKIKAFAAPAYREPNRGNPPSAIELQKLSAPTMQNSDGGISVEPDKRQWLPDLAVSLAQHLSTERRTELVEEPVLAVVVLST
jgi:hypothetical protein